MNRIVLRSCVVAVLSIILWSTCLGRATPFN